MVDEKARKHEQVKKDRQPTAQEWLETTVGLCDVNPLSSRTCEQGTKSCVTKHGFR